MNIRKEVKLLLVLRIIYKCNIYEDKEFIYLRLDKNVIGLDYDL